MGPLTKARDGNPQAALMSLGSSTFRRVFRLILPTTIAGFIAWFLCQLGFYALAARCEAFWMRNTSPLPDPSFRAAIYGLLFNTFELWRTGNNVYERNQWSLPFLLQGSMVVYLALLATLRCTPRWRMTVFFGLYAFSWAWADAMIGLNVFGGAFLAELNMHLGSAMSSRLYHSVTLRVIAISIVVLGLYLSGFPENRIEWASWSTNLRLIGLKIFPKNVDQFRYWPSVGVQLITIGVMLSPLLQDVLTHPALLWLGGASFPIYLLHGPIIRSVLAWILFGFREPITRYDYNHDGTMAAQYEILPMPTGWMYTFALPLFFVILFACAHAWNLWIEPWCAYWTKNMEEMMMGMGDHSRPIEMTNGTNPFPKGGNKSNGILPH